MDKSIKLQQITNENLKYLDDKNQQTTYKIEYVSEYVKNWLFVVTNIREVKNINFIDAMCNAGIYQDCEIGTSIKVLNLFISFASKHRDKEFNLILNDNDSDRIRIIDQVIDVYKNEIPFNVHICIKNEDVNAFLNENSLFKKFFNCYPSKSSNILFVDPYNFSTVKISALEQFFQKYYCEFIFNVFTSDYVRNQEKGKIIAYCKEEGIPSNFNGSEIISYFKDRLKIGHIKYSFSYEFKNLNNVSLYQIMFCTPNSRGLEKLKEALWKTFDGEEFHRNKPINEFEQMCLFSKEEQIDDRLESYASVAKDMLISEFNHKRVSYSEIEIFIIENTMLNDNHIIRYILKPLIKENKIKKMNNNGKTNYKEDFYYIGERQYGDN